MVTIETSVLENRLQNELPLKARSSTLCTCGKPQMYVPEAPNVRPSSLALIDRAPGGNVCSSCWQDELYVGLKGN